MIVFLLILPVSHWYNSRDDCTTDYKRFQQLYLMLDVYEIDVFVEIVLRNVMYHIVVDKGQSVWVQLFHE